MAMLNNQRVNMNQGWDYIYIYIGFEISNQYGIIVGK